MIKWACPNIQRTPIPCSVHFASMVQSHLERKADVEQTNTKMCRRAGSAISAWDRSMGRKDTSTDEPGSAELLTYATFEFIEQLEQQEDIASLLGAFQKLIERFGFNSYCIGDPASPTKPRANRVWGIAWPQEWMKRHAHHNYIAADPVIQEMLVRNTPFRWRDVRVAEDGLSGKIMDEAGEFKMSDGFGLPIYSPDGTVIGISMGTDRYEISKRDEACLHLAAIYFHAKLERMRALETPRPLLPRLTPRERECLSWVAAGKTDWEISQILNISQQTAHEHVQNALVKLNATTRAQAVAIALLTRQISV